MEWFERLAWEFVRPVLLRHAANVLKRELLATRSMSEWVDFAYSFHEALKFPGKVRNLFSIAPLQIRHEIVRLLQTVGRLNPRRTLEIGTANGGTLFLLARVAARDGVLISVDLPERLEGGGFPTWRTPLYLAFGAREQKIHLIRADSHSPAAVDEVKEVLRGEDLDFLLIDADHTYGGVSKDFRTYSTFVRDGGLVVLHDIVPDYETRFGIETQSYTGEVYRFWKELKDRHQVLEIIEDPNQDGYGIGILTID